MLGGSTPELAGLRLEHRRPFSLMTKDLLPNLPMGN